jgi:hypothetical protein
MKIRRRTDGMLCDAELRPGITTDPEQVSDLDPSLAVALARVALFWHSTVDAVVQLEGGEEIGTFRQGSEIRREEEGGWILVYASDDERRRLREAGYKFD